MRKHEPSAGFPIEESFLRLRDTEFLVTDLLPTQKYAPTYLAAPVFDERRQVAFTLVMTGLGTLPGRTVERIGKKLRASCDRITTALAGEFPTTPGEVETPAKPRRATTARS
jgi:hypothetical protein